MKHLLIAAALLILSSCSNTGIQVKNNSDITLYSVVISYYDEGGSLLNSYPVADSLKAGDMSIIMDAENASSYAKISVDAVPKAALDSISKAKDKANTLYAENPILPYILEEIDNLILSISNKEFYNKYYINEGKITSISINNTNKVY